MCNVPLRPDMCRRADLGVAQPTEKMMFTALAVGK